MSGSWRSRYSDQALSLLHDHESKTFFTGD